jgi:hypothetical protein
MLLLFVPWILFSAKLCAELPKPPPKTTHVLSKYEEFIEGTLEGQLGNQFFEIAAATALALENNATAIFPQLKNKTRDGTKTNYDYVFFRVNAEKPHKQNDISTVFQQERIPYTPIPYTPNMKIKGFFQSEKYFAPYKQEILNLFEPDENIINYLKNTHAFLEEEKNKVAVHVRTYFPSTHKKTEEVIDLLEFVGYKYYKNAMDTFPDDAFFVIFSDNVERTKKTLKGYKKKMLFIENQPYYLDFFLMTLCDHTIISNSSFSWWGAYLNKNPDQIVVAPSRWFSKNLVAWNHDIYVPTWKIVEVE